jgi:uncharacterized protein (DUF1499 family)
MNENNNPARRWLRRFMLLVALSCLFLFGVSMSAKPPSNLGVHNGRLTECPESPNCVASNDAAESQRMEAIVFSGSAAEATGKLKKTIQRTFSRAKLVDEDGGYLRYEFTSLIFRFVDDVEFLVDDGAKLIGFRSASRVGHSDLGANRRRMKKISQEFSK